MSEYVEAAGHREQWRDIEAQRAAAFRAAGRHSALVRVLKSLMIVASLALIIGGLVIYIFDPFRKLGNVTDFSIASLGVNGSHITMELPHLSGFRQDGRPYDMRAHTMTQDLKKPNAFDMRGIEGVIGMADKGSANVTANEGHYDSTLNAMDLEGNIHVRSNSGYEAFMEKAHIDFKTSSVSTKLPVKTVMNATIVTADGLEVKDSGKFLLFEGHVKTHIVPQKDAEQTAGELKGTSK